MENNYGMVSNQGPLGKLYESPYTFTNLFYPRNLDTDQRAHCIVFYVNVAKRSSFLRDDEYYFGLPSGSVKVLDTGGRAAESYNGIATSVVGDGAPDAVKDFAKNFSLSRKTKRISSAIALYMPDNVSVAYNNNWQDTSFTSTFGKAAAITQGLDALLEAGKQAFKSNQGVMNILSSYFKEPGTSAAGYDLAGTTADNVFGQGAKDFVMYFGGYAINPQLEVLYKGVSLRTFQFDFIFSPFNREEAKNVKNIIEMFKFHAAPEVLKEGAGRYMVPPSEFDIDFLYKGQRNPNIHQIGTCVLTGINIDYSPNGWSTFGGDDFDRGAGSPVQAKLSLSFQEVEIVTKDKVKNEGY